MLSEHHSAWQEALAREDEPRLWDLAARDEPRSALLELATYVSGRYWGVENATQVGARDALMAEVRPGIRLAAKVSASIRRRIGWEQREIDRELLRFIRRSSALSVVLGAGASMAAGGPSWPQLVRRLLERAIASGGSAEARRILAAIRRDPGAVDTDTLKAGAQVCADAWGPELPRHLWPMLYEPCPEPGPIHRAIAKLAGPQRVPDRGPGDLPGWDAIITYNFDDLMGEALEEAQVPHAVVAMSGGRIRGDPNALAQNSDWWLPVYHLHGYTPRRLFRMTHAEFVFSTHQYAERYGRGYDGVIALALERHLASAPRLALYVGCSFQDGEMNGLLAHAAEIYPARLHFALVQWPERLDGRVPRPREVAERSRRYLRFGVQPVWFEDFEDIPPFIEALR